MTKAMQDNLYKTYIQAVHEYQPGKPISELERELGIKQIVKLASNENPLGPSPEAVKAMRKAIQDVHLYPEGTFKLTEVVARELKVETDQVIFGNGSNEIIELLTRGFVGVGDEVISSETSFLVYPILTQVCGAKFVSVPMKDYSYDLDGILAAITEKTKVIFIANPNNPTGTHLKTAEVEAFLKKVPNHVIVCFDEAYVDFVDDPEFPEMLQYVGTENPTLVVLRTFSKSYGLAGLRIGYAVATPEMVSYLHKIRQPFNVNSIAQVAATAAIEDKKFLARTKRLNATGKKYFYKNFKQLDLEYLPSQANFVLVNVKKDANEVFTELLKGGVIVRSMKAYGLDTWIRVTIGKRAQNELFMSKLKTCLGL